MTNPEGYTALGFVGFTDKGTYDPTYQYAQNDLAHRAGSIWRCLIDNTQGITPTEGANWTLFMGEPTNMAEKIIAPLEDSPSENSYSAGQQLIFNDNLYEVIGAIAVGDNLVTYESDPTNANIKLAPKVSSQIQTLTNETSDIVNVLGAKNLLPNKATSQVINGVTFTVNSDGSVTANGTATDIATLALDTRYTIENGNYILSGCPNGGDSSHYEIQLINGDGTGIGNVRNYEGDTEFEASASITYRAQIVIRSGQTVSNLVFRPMIRPSSIVDSTYVPYAKTNRELTEEVDTWVAGTITPASGVTLNTDYSYFRYNPKAKIGILQLYVTANTRTDNYIATISGAVPSSRQFWGIWADSITGASTYHRAVLASNHIDLTGPGLTGFTNIAFELN